MNVLTLKPVVHENVVKALEEHLAAAKAGNIIGFCIAYENPLGGTGMWVSLGNGCRPVAIIGQLHSASIEMTLRNAEQVGE